jgi:hypothetical protein
MSKDDDSLHRFGDYIVWRQLLDQVRTVKATSLIFATDDSSDDWWWRHDGKTIGPHPSLVHEAQREANCHAYLYRGDQFINYGTKHFGLKADQKLIDEAATIRRDLLARNMPVSPIPRLQVRRALASFDRLEDPGLLWELGHQIWRSQRGGVDRESLDQVLNRYGLPGSIVVLEHSTNRDSLRRGAMVHQRLMAKQRSLAKQLRLAARSEQPTPPVASPSETSRPN